MLADLADAPPCFHWRTCRRTAAIEKSGRSLCVICAAQYKGQTYPLRAATTAPLYGITESCAAALDMLDIPNP